MFSDMRAIISLTVVGVFIALIGLGSFYTVAEGHQGVVKTWGKATSQVGPGFHFKIPIAQSVERVEVRQRRAVEDLSSATANQLPMTAKVSINWTIDRSAAMDIFVRYGSVAQFEDRILGPKLRQVAKESLSKFRADQLIREREIAAGEIGIRMTAAMEPFPVTIDSPQIENIQLPEQYMASVMAKEKAREDAEREKHNLERQRLEAMREVNTADADKEAAKKRAEGKAFQIRAEAEAQADAIRIQGQAQADALRLIGKELNGAPALVSYEAVQRWGGMVPATMLGQDQSFLLGLPIAGK